MPNIDVQPVDFSYWAIPFVVWWSQYQFAFYFLCFAVVFSWFPKEWSEGEG